MVSDQARTASFTFDPLTGNEFPFKSWDIIAQITAVEYTRRVIQKKKFYLQGCSGWEFQNYFPVEQSFLKSRSSCEGSKVNGDIY